MVNKTLTEYLKDERDQYLALQDKMYKARDLTKFIEYRGTVQGINIALAALYRGLTNDV